MSADATVDPTDDPAVVLTREGGLARIELDRPRSINALTHEMVHLMQAALEEWREDDSVRTVLVTGRGERGLCAGGDIVSIYRDALAGQRGAVRYWADEYRLDHLIATYPKPYVVVMDGIVLGGGIGISAHGSHRVVTERSSLGMPETGIGLVPDVGGGWLLSRAPGELGTHVALTGGSVGPGDALAIGMADHFVASERIEELAQRLATQEPDAVLAALAGDAPPGDLLDQRSWIDPCYAGDDVSVIAARLRAHGDPAAAAAADALLAKSPTATTVALASLRRSRTAASLADVLVQDLRLTARFLDVPDFVEGIRAQVVDKDRSPRWSPASLDEVDPAAVAAMFDPLPEGDLELPTITRSAS